jgi:N-acylneuraminate cytidylyltransferase
MPDGRVIAIIPARGGSKGVPRKNLRTVGGKPLLAHSIYQARAAEAVHGVFVSTDDEEIASLARQCGATVVPRPAELSGDTASSESALLHTLDYLAQAGEPEPDLVVFLQCTSPVRRPEDVDEAVRMLRTTGADSMLSVVESHRFLWRNGGAGAVPVNYDHTRRPRRQDRAPEWVENGSIYLVKARVLRETGNRLGGRIALYPMDYWSGFEIDTEADLALCDWILRTGGGASEGGIPRERIDLIAIGSAAASDECADAAAVVALDAPGEGAVPLIVVSPDGRGAAGPESKLEALTRHLAERGVDPVRVAYLGRDASDLECMRRVGCAVAVPDAAARVLCEARFVLETASGPGAIRELYDLLAIRPKHGTLPEVEQQ